MFNHPTLRNSDLADFRREVDRLFDDFWLLPSLGAAAERAPAWAPATEIDERDDHYLLSIEVPGMKREELRIEAVDDQLVVSGERKLEERREGKGSRYSERRFGRFRRAFTIPSHVDAGKIEAQYEDGILKIYVPKAEAAKPRQIRIGDSSSGGIFGRLLGKKEPEPKTLDPATGENVA
jgi:HSP20 family protein